jgi:hypothetical protein
VCHAADLPFVAVVTDRDLSQPSPEVPTVPGGWVCRPLQEQVSTSRWIYYTVKTLQVLRDLGVP